MNETFPICCPGCATSFTPNRADTLPYGTSAQCPPAVAPPKEILFCTQCHLGIAWPLFSEADESIIYNQGEFWKKVNSKINLRRMALPLALAESRWRFAKPHLQSAAPDRSLRILDIGAGQGAFGLAAAMDSGVNIEHYTAVEPDQRLAEELCTLWKKLGLKAELQRVNSLANLASPKASYDLIVLSHVMEHLSDPRAYLRILRSWLNPQGMIFAEVPHQDFLFKQDIFPHVLFFTADNLKLLLEKEHFIVERTGVFGKKYGVNPLGKYISKTDRLISRAMSKLSGILPLNAQKLFYSHFYGADKNDPQGIWLRALAR